MSRRSSVIGVLLAAAVLLSACTQSSDESTNDESPKPPSRIELPPSAETGIADGDGMSIEPEIVPAEGLPASGDCMVLTDFRSVDCAEPHTMEVAAITELPGDLPRMRPEDDEMLRLTSVECAEPVADYVGSGDINATRLHPWTVWPSQDGWARDERWLVCGLAELGTDLVPTGRTGSVRDALVGEPFYDFQACLPDSPTEATELRYVPCDEPHRAEALPGVLPLPGRPNDPMPSAEEIEELAAPHCEQARAAYLGGAERDDIALSWRVPELADWRRGSNTVVCYVSTEEPVGELLLGIGDRPLPE
ncbi:MULTISPECIES: septum formation family protein [Actinoalloteichus]|uniref:Septum formation n=1 Tax=Actinoalloteichus fjordicus TaxID=1612552 RepID=A0AAC9PVB8_9PSEU|nr:MULTISPECIES: septum formation family protein [Actinoalloteichus]APU17962.1 Septum formation [Actinoalloteichus fjordicus]APU24041.1 Septum formation [Actinoalloteichus sp. GBA129-24]